MLFRTLIAAIIQQVFNTIQPSRAGIPQNYNFFLNNMFNTSIYILYLNIDECLAGIQFKTSFIQLLSYWFKFQNLYLKHLILIILIPMCVSVEHKLTAV